MEILTRAVGEAVVAVGALVTVEAVEVGFTRALAAADLTDLALGAVDVTLARHTARVAVVSHVAPGTRTPTTTHSTHTRQRTDMANNYHHHVSPCTIKGQVNTPITVLQHSLHLKLNTLTHFV